MADEAPLVSAGNAKKNERLQAKVDKMVFVARLATASKTLGRAVTDDELYAALRLVDDTVTQLDVSKAITALLKDGAFVESATRIPDASGKKLVRQTGIREVVPDGVEIAQQRAMAAALKLSELAGGLAVHLSTSLRRRHSADISIEDLQKRILEAFDFIINKEKKDMATTVQAIAEGLSSAQPTTE